MSLKILPMLLASAEGANVIVDPYWTNVTFLLRGDTDINTYGLPFYRDFSKYQYKVRQIYGSANDGLISTRLYNDSSYPVFPTDGNNIQVSSYLHINNKPNQFLRIAEINSGVMPSISLYGPTYLDIMQQGNPYHVDLGTGNFTIELSFFAEEVNLPYQFQTLFSNSGMLGKTFSSPTPSTINTYISILNSASLNNCMWLGLDKADLRFAYKGITYKINTTSILKNTWYHICIQRVGNQLWTYLNGTRTNIYTYNVDMTTPYSPTDWTFPSRLTIGCEKGVRAGSLTGLGAIDTDNRIDTCFSGGISNFRITKGIARYNSSFYTIKLPFPVSQGQNKIDSNYTNVLFNYPGEYDLYDYSKYFAHPIDTTQRRKVFSYDHGFLYLGDGTEYISKNISANLSNTEWTIEFYLNLFFGQYPMTRCMSGTNLNDASTPNTPNGLAITLSNYNTSNLNSNASEVELPILSLVSNGVKFIDISQRFVPGNNAYMAFKASTNGTSWLQLPSEANINFGGISLPNNTIKFNASTQGTLPSGLTATTTFRYNSFDEPLQHYAIQRLNNILYFFINGVLHKSVTFSNVLFGENKNNLELHLGGFRGQFLGRISTALIPVPNFGNFIANQVLPLDIGIKGVKITNKAKYSTSGTNLYMDTHSIHPLPLESNITPPPRARILAIIRKINNITISSSEAEWYIYWSQPIQTLTLDDFSLTQSEGLTGTNLISLSKINEYQYVIKANTGSATGKLTLNFIDRKTLFYKGSSNFISNGIGELNFEGDYYIINKQPPVPILTSGSNPYINGPFQVILTFQGAIANFYPEKIGLVNCKITNIIQIDDVNVTYQLTIAPINQDIVIVQCLEGVAQTETGINSTISQPLTRIYSTSFPILQLPLNLTTTKNDLSPNRLVLSEIITNNTIFDNTRFPIGETSTLRVIPSSEQSGLKYTNFNAVSSVVSTITNTDWTIEFFLRINGQQSGTTNFSHILSVDNVTTGFSIISTGTQLQVRRTVSSGANLFTDLTTWRNLGRANNTTYPQWTDNTFTQQEKFPHFAITKQGSTYRFYVNGSRVALISSPTTTIDITKGDIYVGYYPARITDIDYYLSDVRLTLGSALYTAANVNIPALPYTVLPNILDNTELFSFISIYSNNSTANRARLNDEIKLKFTSIFNLQTTPAVTILGRSITPTEGDNNTYIAITSIQSSDPDGKIPFTIDVTSEPGMPSKSFTNTTNGSEVIIDKTPLTANITTTEPNNNNYIIPCQILFSEPVTYMDLTSLTATNCVLSNLLKIDSIRYTFTAKCLNNGTFSIQLQPNKVIDLANNFNIASNTLTRTGAVPTYVPDPYWNNVLLCLQPTTNIIDESSSQVSITANNIVIDNALAPNNIGSSMYFNGNNSSLEFNLNETLPSGIDYTIEFFAYIKSSAVFRLGTPTIQPANNITATSFQANWQSVSNASSYILDISTQSNFNTYLPGFKNLNVGNTTSTLINSSKSIYLPIIQADKYIGTRGFVSKWNYPYDSLGYVYDVALDANFTKKLYLYNNKFTKNRYAKIGTLENLTYQPGSSSSSSTSSSNSFNLAKGVVITGLLSNSNYPKLYYFLEEETIRLYKNNKYTMPAIAEDVDSLTWLHIAIVNSTKYTYLYINGKLQDKIRNTGFSTDFDIGYDIGNFYGWITGLRITKGVARYTNDNFIIPTLPYPKN